MRVTGEIPLARMRPGTQTVAGFNQIRLIVTGADRGAITLRSTLAPSYRLNEREDEQISFTDSDLLIFKNESERKVKLTFREFLSRHFTATHAVFQPSRQPTGILTAESKLDMQIVLGPGETMVLRSSAWRASLKGGVGGPV